MAANMAAKTQNVHMPAFSPIQGEYSKHYRTNQGNLSFLRFKLFYIR